MVNDLLKFESLNCIEITPKCSNTLSENCELKWSLNTMMC